MTLIDLPGFTAGQWTSPTGDTIEIASAVTGLAVARLGSGAPGAQAMLDHARQIGGPALRELTFHDRARILKALALYLNDQRDVLYQLSHQTGATLADAKIDIDGGIGTTLVFASKGRREMPDAHLCPDGELEHISRKGSFLGQHYYTPLQGAAVHINAFNFPVWGMLEKFAPTFLAGVPSIIKPATSTAYVAHACFAMMIESGLLPAGSVQLVIGGTGDLLDRLGYQDAVSFTGSASTALALRLNPKILENSVRFTAEQDSLNAALLGPDAEPGGPEFDLFVDEVIAEMTAKAGQKCTAIRRLLVPGQWQSDVIEALNARLADVVVGDPAQKNTQMGALASQGQRADVLEKAAILAQEATRVFGDPAHFQIEGADAQRGAFLPPMLFHCKTPMQADKVHSVEAFGPVSTVLGYDTLDQATQLMNKGQGSLVASVFTHDPDIARRVTVATASSHGRLYFNNRDSKDEATGHGAPLPHMTHGGPGRAGGGEELGGIRAVKHYMQRTAVQGSPDILTAIGGTWVKGAATHSQPDHPFTRSFDELQIGEAISTPQRRISQEDIDHFAQFTGDRFYAHLDEEAAAANPFFPGRVAHGYLLLSFAAGLFVDPAPGPVLANTGLNALSFQAPVRPGDSIGVTLVVKRKTRRTDSYGEVRWDVTLKNQDQVVVAEYELLTMNAYSR